MKNLKYWWKTFIELGIIFFYQNQASTSSVMHVDVIAISLEILIKLSQEYD